MNETNRRWIEAAKTLAHSADVRIACPQCGTIPLKVEDANRADDLRLVDRYLHCEACGSHQVITGVPARIA